MLIKTVFRLPYRQARRGFTEGLLKLIQVTGVKVPSFTQVNRRFRTLEIAPFAIPTSTGW
ncbi:MAG: hypothetical protein ACJATN_002837 [Neolewinella sp.]|jgi:hypothetical protein